MRGRTTATLFGVAICALTACGRPAPVQETSAAPAPTEAAAPAYKVVDTQQRRYQAYVTVEVDSAENLESVFAAVADTFTEEAGYFVLVNCSTGGTPSADNRLANGRMAIGNRGVAATGMAAGEREFALNEHNSGCPAA